MTENRVKNIRSHISPVKIWTTQWKRRRKGRIAVKIERERVRKIERGPGGKMMRRVKFLVTGENGMIKVVKDLPGTAIGGSIMNMTIAADTESSPPPFK